MKNKKINFIVTSHGWSASNWIAHSLNQNENVLCVHSARVEIAEDKELQSNVNLKKNINQLQKGYVNRQARSIDDLYQEIYSKGEASFYGSVHVLRMRDIPIIIDKFGESINHYKLANIVRHPVDLVWSGHGQFKDLFRYDINELYWTTGKVVNQALEFSNMIGEKYNLNIGDFEILSFFGACAILESLKKDMKAYEIVQNTSNIDYIGTFKMELLTTIPNEFEIFCHKIGLSDLINENYITNVFKTGIVNKHKKDSQKLSTKERFDSWEDWQKEVFIYFFSINELQSFYESIGYDFSFIS